MLLNVLGCRLTYQGQAETSAEAWFNIALRPRKPEGSLGRQPRTATSTLTQLLNYGPGPAQTAIDYKHKDESSGDFQRFGRLQRHLTLHMMAAKTKVCGGREEACSAINCSNSRMTCPGKPFFRFPKD